MARSPGRFAFFGRLGKKPAGARHHKPAPSPVVQSDPESWGKRNPLLSALFVALTTAIATVGGTVYTVHSQQEQFRMQQQDDFKKLELQIRLQQDASLNLLKEQFSLDKQAKIAADGTRKREIEFQTDAQDAMARRELLFRTTEGCVKAQIALSEERAKRLEEVYQAILHLQSERANAATQVQLLYRIVLTLPKTLAPAEAPLEAELTKYVMAKMDVVFDAFSRLSLSFDAADEAIFRLTLALGPSTKRDIDSLRTSLHRENPFFSSAYFDSVSANLVDHEDRQKTIAWLDDQNTKLLDSLRRDNKELDEQMAKLTAAVKREAPDIQRVCAQKLIEPVKWPATEKPRELRPHDDLSFK